jgi:3-ketoacyl-CoA synthase
LLQLLTKHRLLQCCPTACSALSWEPDEEGINGCIINKTLPSEAGNVLQKGVRKMTPRIMTWGQYAEAAVHYMQTAAAQMSGGVLCTAPAPYQPDYTRCVDHFLLHAGGYAVLRAIQKGLRLPVEQMMPSCASLRDFGNTSSASTWYTWSYIESTDGVRKGQTVLQVGVGGGMKSGVAYWRALRDVRDIHPCWAHLGGKALSEADLPRPISVDSKAGGSGTRSAAEQQHGSAASKAAPGATITAAKVAAAAAEVIRLHAKAARSEGAAAVAAH